MERIQLRQSCLHALTIFARSNRIEGRGSGRGDVERVLASVLLLQSFEACGRLLARPIDDEVARNGKEPGVELRFTVVLTPAFHHPDPGFLEDVFGEFAVAGEKDEVTKQPVLIALDQAVEEFRVASPQTTGDLDVLSESPLHRS